MVLQAYTFLYCIVLYYIVEMLIGPTPKFSGLMDILHSVTLLALFFRFWKKDWLIRDTRWLKGSFTSHKIIKHKHNHIFLNQKVLDNWCPVHSSASLLGASRTGWTRVTAYARIRFDVILLTMTRTEENLIKQHFEGTVCSLLLLIKCIIWIGVCTWILIFFIFFYFDSLWTDFGQVKSILSTQLTIASHFASVYFTVCTVNDTLWPQIPDLDEEKAPRPPPRSRYVSVSVDPGEADWSGTCSPPRWPGRRQATLDDYIHYI